jgi:hypothetical protein
MHVDFLREKFLSRFGTLRASKEELDRMFRQFLWEEEEMERMRMILEAEGSRAAAVSSASGGGSQPESAPVVPGNTLSFTINLEDDDSYFRIGFSTNELGPTDISIDWGDGTIDEVTLAASSSTNYQHTYVTADFYSIVATVSEPESIIRIAADQND